MSFQRKLPVGGFNPSEKYESWDYYSQDMEK